MKINRHELKNFDMLRADLERFEAKIHKSLSLYVQRPQNLGPGYLKALDAAGLSLVLERPKEDTVKFLNLALNSGISHFISALELDEDFPIQYEGKQYSYTFKKSTAYTGVEDWQRLFYLAVILRNGDAITLLTQKIHTDYLREANVKGEEVDYLYVDTLKALVTQEMDVIGDLLVQTMDATDPELLPERKHSYVLDIMVPTLCILEPFLSNDQPRFNKELEEALQSHQYFWSKEGMAFDSNGWISLPLLMVSVLAYYNRQFNITVESDYLPKWLIEWYWEHASSDKPQLQKKPQSNNVHTDDPMVVLEGLGARMSDQQLKTFAVRCYQGIDDVYLSEEAKTVIQIVKSQLLGQAPSISPPEALSALRLEILDSSINSDTLKSVVSAYVSELLEKPPLAAAAAAIRARERTANSEELYSQGNRNIEDATVTPFDKHDDMKQVANLLRDISRTSTL